MRADRLAILTLRLLAVSFAVVGTLFFLAPDATLASLDGTGALFGSFPPTPATGARLWLSLSVAYMLLVTIFAFMAQRDLAKARPYLALLFAGKAASSLAALSAYLTVSPAFPYLANFLVDGSIAVGVAAIWVAAPRLAVAAAGSPSRHAPALSHGEVRILRSVLEALAPPGAALTEQTAGPTVAAAVEGYVRAAGGLGAFRWLLRGLDLSPFFLPPLWLRRFSRLSLEDRVRILRAWEDSHLWPRRQAIATLKLVTLTQVYGQPEVLRTIGYQDPLDRVPLAGATQAAR
ncbi:MAG: hypothetical protein IT386_05940 [Deltaproteobacteria bacterium]|nr:hypothetical protein [Deltaproteobacteria bacterium]